MGYRFKSVENLEVCSICGGECCKLYPGIMFPTDLPEVTVENLVKLFWTGTYSIDWWEGGKMYKGRAIKGYFIRPKALRNSPFDVPKGMTRIPPLMDPTWGGRCIFLVEDKGCELELKDRPMNCRVLVPYFEKGKRPMCSTEPRIDMKKLAIKRWAPYNDLIHKAYLIVRNGDEE